MALTDDMKTVDGGKWVTEEMTAAAVYGQSRHEVNSRRPLTVCETYFNAGVDVRRKEQILAATTFDDLIESGFEDRQMVRVPGGDSVRVYVHRMDRHFRTFEGEHAGRRPAHISGADAANSLDRPAELRRERSGGRGGGGGGDGGGGWRWWNCGCRCCCRRSWWGCCLERC